MQPHALRTAARGLVLAALLAPLPAAQVQVAVLDSEAASSSHFTYSVALDGDVAFVTDDMSSLAGPYAGAVLVYGRDDGGTPGDPFDDAWRELTVITPSVPLAEGVFGSSISVSDGSLFVGAPGSFFALPPTLPGLVFAYERDRAGTPADPFDDAWVEVAILSEPGGSPGDRFGLYVAVEGDTALIPGGAGLIVYGRDDAGTPGDPLDDGWLVTGGVSVPPEVFGWGVRPVLEGDTALVGGFVRDDATFGIAGSVSVLARDDGGTPGESLDDVWSVTHTWTAPVPSIADNFGVWSGLAGDMALVAASRDDGFCPGAYDCDSGAVFVYARDDAGTPGDPFDDAWVSTQKLVASDAAPGLELGNGLSIDNGRAAVGTLGTDPLLAHVFERDDAGTPGDPLDDVWLETAKVGAAGATPGILVGQGVDLEGDTLLACEPVQGDGAAYVFTFAPPPPLYGLPPSLSVAGGGSQILGIGPGAAHADRPYLLLGSAHGTAPGFALFGATVPLVPDRYLRMTMSAPYPKPLSGSSGLLDDTGRALASFTVDPGALPALAGVTLHHAYVVFHPVSALPVFVSQPVGLELTP